MSWNVPDDWNSHYSKCSYCGNDYHASEGGCHCLEDHEQCAGCAEGRGGGLLNYDPREVEGWHHVSQLTAVGDKFYCDGHYACDSCGNQEKTGLYYVYDSDMLLCPNCGDEDRVAEIADRPPVHRPAWLW